MYIVSKRIMLSSSLRLFTNNNDTTCICIKHYMNNMKLWHLVIYGFSSHERVICSPSETTKQEIEVDPSTVELVMNCSFLFSFVSFTWFNFEFWFCETVAKSVHETSQTVTESSRRSSSIVLVTHVMYIRRRCHNPATWRDCFCSNWFEAEIRQTLLRKKLWCLLSGFYEGITIFELFQLSDESGLIGITNFLHFAF